jgi:hypothetical protein
MSAVRSVGGDICNRQSLFVVHSQLKVMSRPERGNLEQADTRSLVLVTRHPVSQTGGGVVKEIAIEDHVLVV